MQSLLILDETTLFFYNLACSRKQPKQHAVTAIRNWSDDVAKSAPLSQRTTTSVASTKRTTSSSSAVIAKKSGPPPTKKTESGMLKPRDVGKTEYEPEEEDAGYGGFAGEDESAEREAAMSSPIKGNKWLTSKVSNIKYIIILHFNHSSGHGRH